MTQRLNPFKAALGAIQAMSATQEVVDTFGLDYKLVELVKIRASQLNGCGYCLHMHSRDTRAAGESEDRLHVPGRRAQQADGSLLPGIAQR